MSDRIAAVTFLCVALCVPVLAQQKSGNASGTWKLNKDKSSFGGDPKQAPADIVWIIKDSDDAILLHEVVTGADGQEHAGDYQFAKGGKESVNQMGDAEVRTTLTQDDNTTREQSTITMKDGTKLDRKSTAVISEDGKVLTMNSTVTGPKGAHTSTLVFDKQE